MSTGPPAQSPYNFVWTSKFFSFYLELYKNKFKNLIRTSTCIFKCSFLGLFNVESFMNEYDLHFLILKLLSLNDALYSKLGLNYYRHPTSYNNLFLNEM